MVSIHGNTIHLANGETSLLLRVREDGKIEQVHFGARVSDGDAEALRVRPAMWGPSVLYTTGDRSSCLERVPLFYSDAARSDYRESPVELLRPAGDGAWEPFAPDFVFESAEPAEAALRTESGMPLARDPLDCLRITTVSRSSGLRLIHWISVFETAITRRCVLENAGEGPVTLAKLCSMQLDVPGDFSFHSFGGGWIAEAHEEIAPVGHARVVNESVYGFSSATHNPAVALLAEGCGLDCGEAVGINLIYSGNHRTSAQKSYQGLNRVLSGISPDHFAKVLRPGERFETPEAVISRSGAGRNGLSRNMQRFVTDHVIPARWRLRERPVVYNNWEGTLFHFTEDKLLSLAETAAGLGCELFVLDDGWFGERNGSTAGLGDYWVNTEKLPHGLGGLAERIRGLGMEFGLWFEPECVNPDSDLYRAHPDWAIHQEGLPDLYSRNQLLLDLRKTEVRDYIVENVGRIIDENRLAYVKWDMNRQSPLLGADAHEFILGLYDVLGRIFGPRPEVLLESCSSGGNRFDLGILCYGPQVWTSDNTDPVDRIDIQGGLSLSYPQSCFGAHVSASPHPQTLRDTPLSTRFNVAAFGCLGYELDLSRLTEAEKDQVREQIAYYKAHRRTFQFGSLRRNAFAGGVCLQADGEGESMAGVFHKAVPAAPGYEFLRLRMPEDGKVYRVEAAAQDICPTAVAALHRHGGPADTRIPDTVFRASASGAALAAGIPLPNLSVGTGYSAEMRMQGDYGSNLFLVAEE